MSRLSLPGCLVAAGLMLGVAGARADEVTTAVADLQQRWAVANYELRDKPREAALDVLAQDAAALTRQYPQRAEAWVWSGIIRATLAGARGGLGALGIAKQARDDLEHALTLSPKSADGAAYTTLGTLYHKVPDWPVSFGDDKHAEQLMRQALDIAPNDIDANYFYGEFEYDEGHPAQAVRYLERARLAPPRPGREIADRGRQQEIAALLAKAGAQ